MARSDQSVNTGVMVAMSRNKNIKNHHGSACGSHWANEVKFTKEVLEDK